MYFIIKTAARKKIKWQELNLFSNSSVSSLYILRFLIHLQCNLTPQMFKKLAQ